MTGHNHAGQSWRGEMISSHQQAAASLPGGSGAQTSWMSRAAMVGKVVAQAGFTATGCNHQSRGDGGRRQRRFVRHRAAVCTPRPVSKARDGRIRSLCAGAHGSPAAGRAAMGQASRNSQGAQVRPSTYSGTAPTTNRPDPIVRQLLDQSWPSSTPSPAPPRRAFAESGMPPPAR